MHRGAGAELRRVSSHLKGELAEIVLLESAMSFGGLGQGKRPGDLDVERARLDQAVEPAHDLRIRLAL